jgi:hypothetical protein
MTLSTRQIRLIAGFAVLNIVLVVVGWMALISPQQSRASSAAAQVSAAQTQLAETLGNSQSSNKQPAIHTSGLYTLDTALPAQADQPDLIFELDRLATASSVKILGISPQTAQATTTGYTVQPINLQLSGTYFQITNYLRKLRTLVSEHQGRLTANGPLLSVLSAAYTNSTAHDELATVQIQAFYYGVAAGATPPADTSTTDTTTTTGS